MRKLPARRKPGRPPADKPKQSQMTIRMEPDLHDRAIQRASRDGVPVAEFVRCAVRSSLSRC